MTNNINVMEAIWETSEKAPDGFLHFPPEMIDILWENGFIDTKQFPKNVWQSAVASFKQADGNYRFNRDAFLSLDIYRYRGKIKIPFDPMKINEGKYTDEGFDQLVRDSISPSVSLETSNLHGWIENLKKEFRQPDDLILIQTQAKQKIKKLLEDHPSPLRRLEIMYDHYLTQEATPEELQATQAQVSRVATPEEAARFQQSSFTTTALSFAEVQAQKLKEIAKTQKAKEAPPTTTGEELKKITRSKKGLRG